MKLLCDDYKEVYVWVDDLDEDHELSPHFDYEETQTSAKNAAFASG